MKLSIIPLVLTLGVMFVGVQLASATDPAPPPVPVPHTVRPGENHTNGDGVTVTNTGEVKNMTINPKTGNANSETTVGTQNGAQGTVEGIDANDTVNVSSNSNVTITGTGGTVNVTGSGASATITNNAPTGGGNITAHGPGGTTVTIPPGSTATVST